MKERGILFSAPMVRALLAGTKTQTRRVAPISDIDIKMHGDHMVTWGVTFSKPVKGVLGSYSGGKLTREQGLSIIASQFSPFGIPGDRLWVREAWRTLPDADDIAPRNLMNVESYTHYEADSAKPAGMGKLRPSMFMPRWASRITLEITEVRVERLQQISEADALAEGAPGYEEGIDAPPEDADSEWSYRASYMRLWDRINGAGAAAANPWVWAVSFKRVEATA